MLRKHSLIVIGLITLAIYLSGCSNYYGVANLNTSTHYVPKPAYRGQDTSATYVGGAVHASFGGAYNDSDQLVIGQLMSHRSFTGENYSAALGGLVYAGIYDTPLAPSLGENHSLWGVGGFGEVSFDFNGDWLDYRFIGVRTSVFYEAGEFFSFRERAALIESLDIVNLTTARTQLGISAFSEFLIKFRTASLGIRQDLSWLVGGESSNLVFALGAAFTKNRYTVNLQANTSLFYEGTFTTLGVHYRIK